MIMKRSLLSLLLVSFSTAAYANTYNCSDASRSHEMQLTFTSDLSSVRYVAGPVSGPLTNAGIANRQGTQNAAIIYKDDRASATLTIQQSMLQAGAGSVTFSLDGDSTFICNRR